VGRSRYSGADRRGRVCPFFVPEIWVCTTSKQVGDVSLSVQKLNELLQPLVEDLGYEFVGLEYNSNPKHSVLRIYIDNEDGVGISDCETVSRETAALLDVKDPIKSHYNLEVSSPGLDRPLFTLAHYIEFKGREVKINLFAPLEGRRKFQGLILDASDTGVNVDQDGTDVLLEFSNIAKARLVPDYESILAGHKEDK
jgi:ribosome maturation factor RimP